MLQGTLEHNGEIFENVSLEIIDTNLSTVSSGFHITAKAKITYNSTVFYQELRFPVSEEETNVVLFFEEQFLKANKQLSRT